MENIRLTQFASGAGCGCKISPQVLRQIISGSGSAMEDPRLLVGNTENDDAAVLQFVNDDCIISTADFFMPIVDDAFLFGRIAAANALSDVYAMGGKPLMAIALLGWPLQKIDATVAAEVMRGAKECCAEANVTIAGGHTIESPEPFFGLSVTGHVHQRNLLRNSTAQIGDHLLLTKPLGTGVISTALKRGLEVPGEANEAFLESICALNGFGAKLGSAGGVHALTDVTGFGVLGHLYEMCSGSGLGAELFYSKLPVLPGVKDLLAQRIVPDATYRNWNAYQAHTAFEKGVNVMEAFSLLPDPQTNGGLLIAVSNDSLEEVQQLMKENGLGNYVQPVGIFTARGEKSVVVK